MKSTPKSCSQQRLVFFADYFLPHLGGVEHHVAHLTQVLAQRGWHIDIITRRFKTGLSVKESGATLNPDWSGLKITIHRVAIPAVKYLGLFILWLKLIINYGRLIKQADVVHIHDVMVWYLPFKLLFPGKKVVLTMHGWEGVFPISRKNLYLKQLSAVLADYTLAVGAYLERYYQLQDHSQPDAVIYGGCEALGSPAKDDVTENDGQKSKQGQAGCNREQQAEQPSYSKAEHKPRCVYLGRLAPDTGLPLFLSALAKIREERPSLFNYFHFEFWGGGPLKPRCAQLGQVRGWVQEPQAKLQQAQLAVVGGYLSALEALAAGCVTLATAQHRLKEDYWHLSPFNSYLHLFLTPIELEQTLTAYQQQPEQFQAAVQAGQQWALSQTWQSLADQVEMAYHAV